jgi:hypothetical protein
VKQNQNLNERSNDEALRLVEYLNGLLDEAKFDARAIARFENEGGLNLTIDDQ